MDIQSSLQIKKAKHFFAVLLASWLIAPPALAELYYCGTVDGVELYQGYPCTQTSAANNRGSTPEGGDSNVKPNSANAYDINLGSAYGPLLDILESVLPEGETLADRLAALVENITTEQGANEQVQQLQQELKGIVQKPGE